jgi:hypothetical protein
MKKYLINGALALFAGAFALSCSEKESDFVTLSDQKARAYEEVFKELYGEPDPYQDWGFRSGKIEIDPNDTSLVVEVIDLDGDIAYTRALPFGGMSTLLAFNTGTRAEGTRAANPNHNEWADPAKNNGTAYNIPDPLTDDQKTRVMAYFQANPYLKYVDPHYTTFFVQQVYKGNPTTAGAISSEQYTQTNGTKLTGSNNMDWLYVGTKNDHVNNYNNGEYSGGSYVDVLNTGATVNEASTKSHKDQIMLMENSSTEYVAFGSSTGNYYHTDCCALAGCTVIDAWAELKKDSLQRIGKYGAAVTDKWNRSFVGLDYENRKINDLLTGSNAKALDFADGNSQYVLYNGTMYKKDSFSNFDLTYPDGTKVSYVTDNVANQAIADYIKEENGNNVTKNSYNKNMSKADFKNNYNVEITNDAAGYYNLDKVLGYILQSAHPTQNNGNWVKNIGGRDYVFSDWIVSLASATPATITNEEYTTETDIWTQIEEGRVFCEDLANATIDDLDFNDVVFDVTVWSNETSKVVWSEKTVNGEVTKRDTTQYIAPATKYYASIILRAAGGTIPITVNGIDVHSQFKDGGQSVAEVTMINTRDNKSTTYGSYISCEPVELEGNNMVVRKYKMVANNVEQNVAADPNTEIITLKMFEVDYQDDGYYIEKIPVWSNYGTAKQIQELKAIRGDVPRKFMAPVTTAWTSERKNISLAYSDFGTWVEGNLEGEPWNNVNTNYTYDVEKPYSADGIKLPLVMKARRTVNTDGEQYLWQAEQEYGSTWNLREASATLTNTDGSAFDKFYPGDRLRFRAKDIKDDAWISVAVGDIKPYFIDSEFPNYIKNADGSTEPRTEGCVEVLLDEDACKTLNNYVNNGKITFTVQGRNFTLTGITRVLFK